MCCDRYGGVAITHPHTTNNLAKETGSGAGTNVWHIHYCVWTWSEEGRAKFSKRVRTCHRNRSVWLNRPVRVGLVQAEGTA